MGGPGSGHGYRYSTKITADDVISIDIRHLKKIGILNRSCSGSLRWKRGGKKCDSIKYTCDPTHLVLNYQSRNYGKDWTSVTQTVQFDRTPCHYGGERLWMLCPRCNRRVGILYGAGASFLCRHCHSLPYTSQQEGCINNAISQKHKLGRRIFEHYENGKGFGKKKGMHWSTYYRLHAKYQRYEQQWLTGMCT